MTDNQFKIRYVCGHRYSFPATNSTTEAMRALRRVPCPACRDHPSVRRRYFPDPVIPGASYRFVSEAADGAPLTAQMLDCLYLCAEHDDDRLAKAVPIPSGVALKAGMIVVRGLCDICDGTVAIALARRTEAETRESTAR